MDRGEDRGVMYPFPMRHKKHFLLALAVLLLAVPVAHATCGGGGGGGMGGAMPGGMGQQMPQPKSYLVPWRVLNPAEPQPASPMTLVWVPSAPQDMDLRDSRVLTLYSAQCVGMSSSSRRPGVADEARVADKLRRRCCSTATRSSRASMPRTDISSSARSRRWSATR